MKQHKHPSRHFLTAIMFLMASLGAQGARAQALAEASPGLNDAPLNCSGALSSSIGAETLYFCQGTLSIGKGTLSASQSIKITADGDITVTDLSTITPQLIIESGKTIHLQSSFSGTGNVMIGALGELGIGQPIDPGSTLYIDPSHGTTNLDDGSNSFSGAVSLSNGAGTLVFNNDSGLTLGTIVVGGNLMVTSLSGDIQNAQLVISGSGYSTLSTVSNSGTIPEPGTWALMGLGLAGIASAARRRA